MKTPFRMMCVGAAFALLFSMTVCGENAPVLPRLVDLGASRCVPCKMMVPVLESLKQDYAGRMQVEFIDVWKDPDAGKKYAVQIIPTQIFYDAAGKELFRHEAILPKTTFWRSGRSWG